MKVQPQQKPPGIAFQPIRSSGNFRLIIPYVFEHAKHVSTCTPELVIQLDKESIEIAFRCIDSHVKHIVLTTMRNLRYRQLHVSNRPSNAVVCQGCAKLADVDGKSVIVYASLTDDDSVKSQLCLNYVLLDGAKVAAGSFLSWTTCDLSSILHAELHQPICAGLDVLNGGESVVIALRTGELIEVQSEAGVAELVGEFSDEASEKSGILGLRTSPDGTAFVIVSPVKVTVMSAYWDVIAEAPLDIIAVSASISWRGDGEFFVVSVRPQSGLTKAYVFSREGQQLSELDAATLQNESGALGDLISWQPRVGGFICHAGPASRLSFFERNGLRHLRSDFDVVGESGCSYTIILLEWNAESDKLAVAVEEDQAFFVDIFTRSNYVWYKKQRLACKERPAALLWEEDNANVLHVLLKSNGLISMELVSSFDHVQSGDSSVVAVVDGKKLFVTNFSEAILPPPLWHTAVDLNSCVDSVCCLPTTHTVGALLCDGTFSKFSLTAESWKPNSKEKHTEKSWILEPEPSPICAVRNRCPLLLSEQHLVTIRSSLDASCDSGQFLGADQVCLFQLAPDLDTAVLMNTFATDGTVVAAYSRSRSSAGALVATDNGTLFLLEADLSSGNATLCATHNFCHKFFSAAVSIEPVTLPRSGVTLDFVHCESGYLLVLDIDRYRMFILSKECTSFSRSGEFVTFTTRGHVLFCVPLEGSHHPSGSDTTLDEMTILTFLDDIDVASHEKNAWANPPLFPESSGATRPIDRGSVIVSSLENDVRLVLQAPRGNIETVTPRPIVQAKVRDLALHKEYGKAFRLSRQQRIDMNILVDVDTEAFLVHVQQFVEQVGKASHMSVFLTYLKGTPEKVNSICDAVIDSLKTAGNSNMFSVMLTAYIRKTPPDFQSALLDIWALHQKPGNEAQVAKHLDFLFVLCKDDAALYGHALGLYNLELAGIVAKASGKLDPAEYVPELRRLSDMEESERKYEIDLKLGRNELAFRHLYQHEKETHADKGEADSGEEGATHKPPDVHQRSLAFAIQKAVFSSALELFLDNEIASQRLRTEYGAHLMKLQRYSEAATVYCANNELESAARAYDLAGKWEVAVGAMSRSGLDVVDQNAFYSEVADRLQEHGQAREAAHVRSSVLGDVDCALEIMCTAELWQMAIATVSAAPDDSRWSSLLEAATEAGESLVADLTENSGKVRERGKRLLVVRETKRLLRERITADGGGAGEGSDAFSRTTGTSFASNVSDLTFVGRSAATSVYTTVSGSVSAADKRKEKSAARRQNKAKKKRVKEGHPLEEEFLVQYLRKMAPSQFLKERVQNMMDALLFLQEVQLAQRVCDAMTKLAEETMNLAEDVIDSAEVKEIASRRDWECDALKAMKK